jgi:pilus assembly protein CpaC
VTTLRIRARAIDLILLTGLALCASVLRAETHAAVARILVGTGRTYIIDTTVNIERVSIASPAVAEAVPVNARTLMVNGKSAGETSLIVWLTDGTRSEYEVNVRLAASRIEAAVEQANDEFGGRVHFMVENTTVYLTGSVKNLFESQRAVSIAETLGKVVNLLRVDVPPQEVQVLLKVRFANVDRTKSKDLGISFVGSPMGFPFSTKTGAYPSGTVTNGNSGSSTITLSDALNLLFFDPQINVGATLKALEARAVLQILAEPNLLAMNGHEASFVAGGEFPFPTLSGGGAGASQVTISFRQFGVQIHFLPTITPRGTIRLHLSPEVSSLDFANALTANGSVVPALNTRKVETDIELESGQTFAIAGLLDQRTTESLSKIPGLADIPILGKLFTSKNINVSNSELLIIVTPEIVGPIANPRDIPALVQPLQFMQGKGILSDPPRTPGTDITGPAPEKPKRIEIPIQEMEKFQTEQSRPSGGGMTAGLPRSAGGPAPDITTGGGAPPAPAAETASSPSGLSVGSAPALRIKP